jgi:phosphoribosylformylglycinamidine (FGAM) synthase-like enzyme
LLGVEEGIVVSNGINPRYGDIDTYRMAASAIDEAIRNIVAVGGNPDKIALLDNFCWGNPILSPDNPDGDFKLAQLVRAAQACYDIATVFEAPFISGKDSFHNEYQIGGKTVSIPPTLLISALGTIERCDKAVSMDAKKPDDLVYILGVTRNELGGSHYYLVHDFVGNNAPTVNPLEAAKLYEALHRAITRGFVSSCHDCSEGGLAVAAAETAFAGGYGMEIDLRRVPIHSAERHGGCSLHDYDVGADVSVHPVERHGARSLHDGNVGADVSVRPLTRNDEVLFSESNSRFVVTVRPEHKEKFEEAMKGNVFGCIGRVREDAQFNVTGLDGNGIISTSIDDLKEAWQKPLRW